MINGMRIIDADGHVQERDANWQDLLDPPYRNQAPTMVDCNGRKHLLLEGKVWAKPSGIGCGQLRHHGVPESAIFRES
jgi:hypothetical protein